MISLQDDTICIALNKHDGLWATVGIGEKQSWQHHYGEHQQLHDLEGLEKKHGRWVYHILSYDLKSYIEQVPDRADAQHCMPVAVTVDPVWVFRFRVDHNDLAFEVLQGNVESIAPACHDLMHRIRNAFNAPAMRLEPEENSVLQPTISKEAYYQALQRIQEHLRRGDIYEVNYCHSFEGQGELHDPFAVWLRLLKNSGAPFACFCKYREWVLLCASPERFLRRSGNTIQSQPIKGTIRRGANEAEDEMLRQRLMTSPKERSENVMIVDLVRNDLSRIALRDTVKVVELFGAYRFKTVHHLISTIEAEIAPTTSLIDILQATFPMGSMTGAPKISAMQIAEQLEHFQRGWYSGSVGFVAPNGDFDFNVVIRSIVYNSLSKKLFCAVGGAITHASHIDQEYEETLLKARLLRGTV